jgi:chromate transporter
MKSRPGVWKIFSTWLLLGIQSFGGGSSTFLLIHQACVDRGWLEEEEFVRTWALAQISPGINLVKLTVLVGHRLRGWPGLIAGMAGLLLPSATLTVLMTAGFSVIRSQPLVQAAMKGVLPATIGLSLAMGVTTAQPVLSRARQEGPSRLGLHLSILAGAALLMAVPGVSPLVVLLLAGTAAILLLAVIPVRAVPPAEKSPDEPA